jgi:hypothetical protein
MASALCGSWVYATDLRRGRSRPHARHWLKLAELVGFSKGEGAGRQVYAEAAWNILIGPRELAGANEE